MTAALETAVWTLTSHTWRRQGPCKPKLTCQHRAKAVQELFQRHVDAEALLAALDAPRQAALNPKGFSHRLHHACLAQPQHIVLPEGLDRRVVQVQPLSCYLMGAESNLRKRHGWDTMSAGMQDVLMARQVVMADEWTGSRWYRVGTVPGPVQASCRLVHHRFTGSQFLL